MGYIAPQMRATQLNLERMDIEWKIQLIQDSKMQLSATLTDLVNVGGDYDPDSPTSKQLNERKERLFLLEKKLDTQLQNYKSRLAAINAEYESSKRMAEENMRRSHGG